MFDRRFQDINKIVTLALIRIGLRPDLAGFSYLCYAIELVIRQPRLIRNLCKGIYIQVGEAFETSKNNCVERSIRHAIEDTYLNKNFSELNKMFNTEIFTIHDKPTSGQLIKLIAEYYNLGLYKEHLGID